MTPSARWSVWLLAAATAPLLWLDMSAAGAELSRLPAKLEDIRNRTTERREATRLSWNGSVPSLERTEKLLKPVVVGGGIFETSFAFVAPGTHRRAPAVRGATVLSYLLAPGAWAVGFTPDLIEVLLTSEQALRPGLRDLQALVGPGRESLLAELEACQFIVWAGLGSSDVDRLRSLATRKYGREVLVPGRELGPDLHVTLRFDVAEGIRSGDPKYKRFRPLLQP